MIVREVALARLVSIQTFIEDELDSRRRNPARGDAQAATEARDKLCMVMAALRSELDG